MDKPVRYTDEYQNLYKVLSGFFMDKDINYSHIVSIAQYSPIEWIEKYLFEEVGLVYYTRFLHLTPSIWADLDKETLSRYIQEYKEKCNKNFSFYKMRHKYLVSYLRKKYKCQWIELKQQLEALKYYRKAENMKDKVYTDIDLCESLSDIFIDIKTDYIYIAPIANRFPIDHVKKVYFEWVAPVCCPFFCSPIPSEWEWFDRDELWKDIQDYKAKISNLGFWGKQLHTCFLFYLRNTHMVKSSWKELEKYMNTFKNNNGS